MTLAFPRRRCARARLRERAHAPRAAARRATTRKRRACDAKRETGTAESEVRDGGAVIIHTW